MQGTSTAQPAGLLTRRKAETAREIAEEAARLFAERGVAGVTAAEIAAAAGVSLRTFYRYFATKEDAVAPVLEIGAARWQAAWAAALSEGALSASAVRSGAAAEAVHRIIAAELAPVADDAAQELGRMRPLLRALAEDRELRAVWHRVNHDSEDRIVALLVEGGRADGGRADEGPAGGGRADGLDRIDARILTAAATEAIRIGLEEWAIGDEDVRGAASPAVLATWVFDALAPAPRP